MEFGDLDDYGIDDDETMNNGTSGTSDGKRLPVELMLYFRKGDKKHTWKREFIIPPPNYPPELTIGRDFDFEWDDTFHLTIYMGFEDYELHVKKDIESMIIDEVGPDLVKYRPYFSNVTVCLNDEEVTEIRMSRLPKKPRKFQRRFSIRQGRLNPLPMYLLISDSKELSARIDLTREFQDAIRKRLGRIDPEDYEDVYFSIDSGSFEIENGKVIADFEVEVSLTSPLQEGVNDYEEMVPVNFDATKYLGNQPFGIYEIDDELEESEFESLETLRVNFNVKYTYEDQEVETTIDINSLIVPFLAEYKDFRTIELEIDTSEAEIKQAYKTGLGAFTLLQSNGEDLYVYGIAASTLPIFDPTGAVKVYAISEKCMPKALEMLLSYGLCYLEHQDVPVADIVKEAEIDGKIYKTEIRQLSEIIKEFPDIASQLPDNDYTKESGMMVLTKVRNDSEISRSVHEFLPNGDLQGYSIRGQALESAQECNGKLCLERITDLDVFSVVFCERPKDECARFKVLKTVKHSKRRKKEDTMKERKKEGRDVKQQDDPPPEDPPTEPTLAQVVEMIKALQTRLDQLEKKEEKVEETVEEATGEPVADVQAAIKEIAQALQTQVLEQLKQSIPATLQGMKTEPKKVELPSISEIGKMTNQQIIETARKLKAGA